MIETVAVLALVLVALSFARCAAGDSPTPHPFNVHDLVTFERVGDAQAAPDGQRVAFTVRRTDLENNKGINDIWLMDADGGNLRRLTAHAAGSHQPRWAPDGQSLFFLSGRSDSSQVWRIRIDGGEATQVTDLPLDVGSFVVSPTGTHLAVAIEVFPDAATLDDTKKRLDEQADRKATGRVYDKLFVRHWDSWKDGRRAHLFVVPIGSEPAQGDAAADLMKGLDADAPSKPFGGDEEYTFTPDGEQLVFFCRDKGREEAWSTNFDMMVAPIDGLTPPHVLVEGHGVAQTCPVFSPDGKALAWLAMARPGYEADRLRIKLMDWPNGKPRVLTSEWDRSPGDIVWSRDSKLIYTSADHLGEHPLFAIDVRNGDEKLLVGGGKVSTIAACADRIVFGRQCLKSPTELYSIAPTGGEPQALTHVNAERLAAVKMGDYEQFTFAGWNDEIVHAYAVKPVDFDPKKKYPVAFLIHGGPQGSFGDNFHYRWNPQTYAGAGYAVVMVDFHGSTGYGQDFTDAINGHWGDRPLEDLQKGLAAALEKYPWLDRDRVAALGASYGGYMVNWIHGVWNEPFRCLVCHDGNIDERMAYYDTEELWFPEWERGGTPWDKPEAYSEHNPIDHIGKWCLPTLIIHGALDYRVVDTQGISAFTALQRKGVPSKLLYFPNENHWVLKPHNSIQWHEEVLGWLEQWCKG